MTLASETLQLDLPEGEVHVWCAPLDGLLARESSLFRTMSPDEKARARRFVFERDRERFSVCRGLLRRILGSYLGVAPSEVQFAYGAHGKPRLGPSHAGSGLRFNVSHSGQLALLAFTHHWEVGVDIELLRHLADVEELARESLSVLEQKALLTLPPELRSAAFLRAWTRKEAILKALGAGIGAPLDRFSVSLDAGTHIEILDMDPSMGSMDEWKLYSLDTAPEIAAALAVKGTGDRPPPITAVRMVDATGGGAVSRWFEE